jgi:hypothetical protein
MDGGVRSAVLRLPAIAVSYLSLVDGDAGDVVGVLCDQVTIEGGPGLAHPARMRRVGTAEEGPGAVSPARQARGRWPVGPRSDMRYRPPVPVLSTRPSMPALTGCALPPVSTQPTMAAIADGVSRALAGYADGSPSGV